MLHTTTIIHALAWRCRLGIGRFPTPPWSLGGAIAHLGHKPGAADPALASPPPSQLRLRGSACRHLFCACAYVHHAHFNRRGYGNLGMVLCGCHIAINHCILGVLVIVLMGSCSQWLLFVWLRMGYGFPVLFFGKWGDAWEAPTSIQHASSSGTREP